MSRPPNPYRDQHRALEAQAGRESGRGNLGEANRLWRAAAELKRKGIQEVDDEVRRQADASESSG
jgi:hypothetical protein